MSEILLYSKINKQVAENFIYNIGWLGEDKVTTVRMYCPGGDILAAWGMAAKINESKQKGNRFVLKVDGMAASMGAVLACYFDERIALDTSQFMLHRGSYGTNEDGTPYKPTPEEQTQLQTINNSLKEKLQQVINDELLKSLTGYSLDDLFDESKERINLWLNADIARKIGLVTEVVPLNATNTNNLIKAVAACYEAAPAITNNSNSKKIMTIEDLKKDHPEVFAECQKQAVEQYKVENPAPATAQAAAGEPMAVAIDPKVLQAAVVAELKAMGIEKIEGSVVEQSAQATAEAAAAAANKEKETKVEQDVNDCQKEIDAIMTGKTVE